jgi:peptidoglycan/xylan/chitin deacetylase (PgdA/CDA1 family)
MVLSSIANAKRPHSMIATIQNLVHATDDVIARAYLALFRERGGLRAFLFHSLFRDEREIALHQVDPLQRTTVAQFRAFVEYYLGHGYRFVGPDDVLRGLEPEGKYALISFDDGYYNNTLALPILEQYKVPALFFISTDHVRENKCYWWDVLYRERVAAGTSRRRAYQEALGMKNLRSEQIEEELRRRFGAAAFAPRCDIDRAFTPRELLEFSKSPYVFLGNHTANHGILTNYDDAGVRDQLRRAQDDLSDMTGTTPTAIAYPNGGYNDRVIESCREVGLKLGYTIRPEKVALPVQVPPAGLFRLGRFVPHGLAPIDTQCRTCRSDLTLYGTCRNVYLRFTRPGVSA